MNILYIDLARGSGISLLGELFLELLRITSPISTIDIYSSQCSQLAKEFNCSHYDFIVVNEMCKGCLEVLLQKFDKLPIINIQHSNPDKNYSTINFALNSKTDLSNNIYALDFVPGNIWVNKKLERKGDLIISRICKSKINYNLLKQLPNKPDVYGFIVDEEYFKLISPLINYKGIASSKELINIYNTHKYLYVLSSTECLSIPIREALLCGCIPIVYDPQRLYTKNIESYINYFNESYKKLDLFDWTFTNFYLQFLFGLRAILGIKFKPTKSKADINHLHKRDNIRMYKYELIDEEKLWKNLLKVG